MVLAAALFSLMGVCVKTAAGTLQTHVFWVGFGIYATGLVTVCITARLGPGSLHVNNRPVFFLRGIIGSSGQFLGFATIAYVGLGRGTVLTFLLAVVGAVSGVIILHERLRLELLGLILLATLGVFLTCGAALPTGAEWLGLLTALLSGTTLSLVRLLRKTDSNLVSFFAQTLFGTLLLSTVAWRCPWPATWTAWGLIGAAGLLMMGAQVSMSQGLSMVSVARGGALLMLTPVFSLAAGVMFFDESLTPVQATGCAVVLAASYLAVTRRHT